MAIELDDLAGSAAPRLTIWDPATDETEHLAEPSIDALDVQWLDDGRIVAWGIDAWQVIDPS